MTRDNCGDPFDRLGLSRRQFIIVGALGGLGLTLGDYLRARAAEAAPAAGAGPTTSTTSTTATSTTHLTTGTQPSTGTQTTAQSAPAAPKPKAGSVILIYLGGGISHLEFLDPKPTAPIEYRGELGAVDTAINGVQFGGLFPKTAQMAGKMAVIRSLTHGEAAHERGTHNMLTGYRPSPAIIYPSMGSVVGHEYGPRNDLPPYICIPSADSPFHGSGYLSSAFGPFAVGGDPADPNFSVRDLAAPEGVDPARMEQRKNLLAAVDSHFASLEKSDAIEAMDSFYQRAYALISSPKAREAFNLKAEPDAIRDEYGRHAAGQRLLLARRLVEAGARFVTVNYEGWDHHKALKSSFESLAPPFDQAYSTLLRDLDRRGLLSDTLVLITSEFGRTPRLNKDGGRDHWPKVFSVALAGGGIRGGQAVGVSNALGQEVKDRPVGPADVSATVFTQLGIDPHRKLMSAGNRPIDIAREYNIIKEIV